MSFGLIQVDGHGCLNCSAGNVHSKYDSNIQILYMFHKKFTFLNYINSLNIDKPMPTYLFQYFLHGLVAECGFFKYNVFLQLFVDRGVKS